MGDENNNYKGHESDRFMSMVKKLVIVICAVCLIWFVYHILTETCIIFPHEWTEATCSKPKTCERCGETEGAALGHSYSEFSVVKNPTCTEKGSKEAVCSVCGYKITEDIPKMGHKLGEWEISTTATFDAEGEKVQKCTVCGEVVNSEKYNIPDEERKSIYINQCKTYSYFDISHYPENYDYKYAVFTGKVIEIKEDGESYVLRVNVTKDDDEWTDTVFVTYTPNDADGLRILEDDIITMYGRLRKTHTYTSRLGENITLPLFAAEYISLSEDYKNSETSEETKITNTTSTAKAKSNNSAAQMCTITATGGGREFTDSKYVKIKFTVKNNTANEISRVEVRGTLYDSNGNAITSNDSYIFTLPAYQSKEGSVAIEYSGTYSKYDVKIIN